MERPYSVTFFPNGTAAVHDQYGRQMPRYQVGWHGTTIAAIDADGIDWATIHEIYGVPLRQPPAWWTEQQKSLSNSVTSEAS